MVFRKKNTQDGTHVENNLILVQEKYVANCWQYVRRLVNVMLLPASEQFSTT